MYDEPILDLISAILATGFYPNVCYHKEKRKVIISTDFFSKEFFYIEINLENCLRLFF